MYLFDVNDSSKMAHLKNVLASVFIVAACILFMRTIGIGVLYVGYLCDPTVMDKYGKTFFEFSVSALFGFDKYNLYLLVCTAIYAFIYSASVLPLKRRFRESTDKMAAEYKKLIDKLTPPGDYGLDKQFMKVMNNGDYDPDDAVENKLGNNFNHIAGIFIFAGNDDCELTDGVYIRQIKDDITLRQIAPSVFKDIKHACRLRGEPMVAIIFENEEDILEPLFAITFAHHKGQVFQSKISL